MNTGYLCFNPLISPKVSEPYLSKAFTFHPKTLKLVLIVSKPPHWSQNPECLPLLSKACLDTLITTFLLTYNVPGVHEFVHFLDLRPCDLHKIPRLQLVQIRVSFLEWYLGQTLF